MKTTWTLMTSALICSATFVGCTPEATKKVEEAKKETVEAAKATGEAVKEATKEAVDATSKATKDAVEATKEAAKGTVEAIQDKATEAKDAVVGGIKGATEAVEGKIANLEDAAVITEVNSQFQNLAKSISGIKDVESAKAAVPGLEEVTKKFGTLHDQFNKLPEEAKKTVAQIFESSVSQLKPTLDGLLNLPGVKEVLEPVFKSLVEKLEAFKAS